MQTNNMARQIGSETIPYRISQFNFKHPAKFKNGCYELNLNVPIPLIEPKEEYIHRVMKAFEFPCYIYYDLLERFDQFLLEETTKFYDDRATEDIKAAQATNVDSIVKHWEQIFKAEHVEYSEPSFTSDEELFSAVYHKLVHSPTLEPILQIEQSYAKTAGAAAHQRSERISKLSEEQAEEMNDALQQLNTKTSVQDINDLAAKQLEDRGFIDGKLTSEIEAIHQQQRTEYRAWLMNIVEKMAIDSPLSSPILTSRVGVGPLPPLGEDCRWPEMEESFTIHLGSQLKQMHNVRILSADVLDLCRIRFDSSGVDPRRLETALALYSTGLSGLVLLSDVGPLEGFSGTLNDFSLICQETTELHFPDVKDQFEEMGGTIGEAIKWRTERANADGDHHAKKVVSRLLQPGDSYITKHSNLLQVHVVFHLVVDDCVKSNEMNSRHPVILGLRNILKTAASYDVTSITLPLLLTHEMTEDMTVAWCTRRAELVFKCVKGFMMEAAGTGGAELNNLQFLVPRKISPAVFSALANMLPSIFRVSNALVVKTSPLTPKETVKTN